LSGQHPAGIPGGLTRSDGVLQFSVLRTIMTNR
jgi:hypothetical protein